MEILCKQRLNYARITLYKNYSIIGEIPNLKNESVYTENFYIPTSKKHQRYFDISEKTFYDVNQQKHVSVLQGSDGTFKLPLTTVGGGHFYTTNDKAIKRNYNNPFANIEIDTIERILYKKGDKLIIKKYHHRKYRYAFLKYFKKRTLSDSIIIDTKTGNFKRIYKGKGSDYNFTTNSFSSLHIFYNNFFITQLFSDDRAKKINDVLSKEFNDEEILRIFCKSLNIRYQSNFLSKTNQEYNGQYFKYAFVEWFILNKKIKVPDTDYTNLITKYYPGEKFLKKNDRKLILAILDFFDVKSKITNKILHLNLRIEPHNLIFLCCFFGKNYQKYIGTIDERFFQLLTDTGKTSGQIFTKHFLKTSINSFKDAIRLNEDDKKDLVRFINNYTSEQYKEKYISVQPRLNINHRDMLADADLFNTRYQDIISLLHDHFNMLNRIREYVPETKFRATDNKSFDLEHQEFSNIVRSIRKGWTTEYKFNQQMLEDVEMPIELMLNIGTKDIPENVIARYFPIILKREEDYMEEGDYMHHCVGSYTEKTQSIIVSLRLENSKERITCEFDCQSGECIQARHFCNATPPDDFDLARIELTKKTRYYARRGMLHSMEKIRVPVKINGIEIIPEKVSPVLNEGLFPL